MSDKLRGQIDVDREQLRHLLQVHRGLVQECSVRSPNAIELSALGAMLHGFYTGIENLFKRIALEIDGQRLSGEAWHRKLLDSMCLETAARPPILSSQLRDDLLTYLQFRHVFRQAYSFDLQWEKMAPLVLACEETLAKVERELDRFLATR